ncbi:hypothetical protein CEXT_54161 [Caerostris extrusa]|uniref:Uncharacterized protein n=1 Tax=Caerostris extrusa TaxID=172846 RepID=A0AAV4TGD8_CAEEX|nr:hypothetical protein CEXT_54161 [Caerostris extrusa]
MENLASDKVNESFLKTLWLQRLPVEMMSILSNSGDDLSKLATTAIKSYQNAAFISSKAILFIGIVTENIIYVIIIRVQRRLSITTNFANGLTRPSPNRIEIRLPAVADDSVEAGRQFIRDNETVTQFLIDISAEISATPSLLQAKRFIAKLEFSLKMEPNLKLVEKSF